jgi:hypothetical protein
MFAKWRPSRWLVALSLLILTDGGSVIAIDAAMTSSAQAQFFGDFNRPVRRARPPREEGGFFGNFFGNFGGRRFFQNGPPRQVEREQPVDNARAPAPRKPDTKDQVAPTTSIVVMGDGMADWLAYGLEDAFSDSPEVAIVREHKTHSGLLHYEGKGDLDWWHVARENLTHEKADYVVMMLGVSDRQNIREKDIAEEAEKKANEKEEKSNAADKQQPVESANQARKKSNAIVEFRSDEWNKVYSHRIDQTVAALKSKGVPVFWVGLPSIRGPKSTADVGYLNDLYRERAERAGAVYIDVWDGFVDEAGKFVTFGPDYEGQTRRLRSGDGVYFTKYGAIKLAHYVEREIRRYMNNRTAVALPSSPAAPVPGSNKPAARPLAGPVVPLTSTPENAETLLGGGGHALAHGDAVATQVLVKGDMPPAPRGRADDFAWPPSSANRPTAATDVKSPQARVEPAGAATTSAALSNGVDNTAQPEIKKKEADKKKKSNTSTATQNASVKHAPAKKPKGRAGSASPAPSPFNLFSR